MFLHIAAELQEGDTELLLENTPTKNLFLDDLHELREFIKRRSLEVASESISLIQVYFEGCGSGYDLTSDLCRWGAWMNLEWWNLDCMKCCVM